MTSRTHLVPQAVRDPFLLVVAAVSLLTYALHGIEGMLTRDLAVYSYAGQQVAEGVPPYVGILNRAGPLAHVLPGIGVVTARAGGFDDLLLMRLEFMLFAVACVVAVYLLGRDLSVSRPAGLVTAATFLTFSGFIEYASNGPREKTPMTLFVVLALWAVARKRWFTAGLCVSLATLCLQIAFFTSFTAVLAAALLVAQGERTRALVRIALGGALPVGALALWFTVAGSLRESVDAFLLINARYTTPDPVLPRLEEEWIELQAAYGPSVWLLVVGLVALVGLGLTVVSVRARREQPSTRLLAAFALAALAGLAWNLKEYDDWPDLFPVLPLAAVGIGGLFARLTWRLPARIVYCAAVACSLAMTGVAIHDSVSTRDDSLVTQRASVDAVLDQLPPDATITSVEAPQPLVLTGRTNPTRFQMFSAGLQDYMDDTWPGGMDGLRRDIVAGNPDLIVTGDPVSNRWRNAILTEYVYIGSAPDWAWYARESLGQQKLAALRGAAGFDPGDELAQLPETAGAPRS